MLYLVLVVAVAVLGLAWLGARAYRDEYLMVLHWPNSGTLFFERGDGGRYRKVAVAALPLAAVRYGAYVAAPRAVRRTAAEPRVAQPAPAALAHQ